MKINVVAIASLVLAVLLATASAMDIDRKRATKEFYNYRILQICYPNTEMYIPFRNLASKFFAQDILNMQPEAVMQEKIYLQRLTELVNSEPYKGLILKKFMDRRECFSKENLAAFLMLNVNDEMVANIIELFGFVEGMPVQNSNYFSTSTVVE
ncbi:hypothetical protein IWQ61_010342 [Dispira simplex]|nr:hypothetical protein IWQ61_010342 [Dispira simplex]